MSAPAWLTARPIAHRGLHDRAAGIPENTLAAARAAIAASYAIECDVQMSADGEAMVFHDETLGRLTGSSGPVSGYDVAALSALAVAGTAECIPTLAELLGTVAGRVPVIVEVKSRFSGDLRLSRRVADLVAGHDGPVCVESFDPAIVAAFRDLAPTVPRGIVGETTQDDPIYAAMAASERRALAHLLHLDETRPDFLSWRVDDLPCAPAHLCRLLGAMPVTTWTVRTQAQRALASVHADQIVFEGFVA